jgi:hydroxymethylcytosylglucuronate/cytosylglucuronate synthase
LIGSASELGLLVASVDFGYGSSGKLASILAHMPGYRCVLAGSTHSRHITASERFEAYYPGLATVQDVQEVARRHRLSGALVVLNPDFADLCERASLPTVYVDSLAYLWTDYDPVPTGATAYCAQMFPFLPSLSWPTLRRIRNLQWVEGIVPGSAAPSEPPSSIDALINLGGLGTHLLQPHEAAYPVIVVDAALRALARFGARRVRLTGNLAEAKLSAVVERHSALDIEAGPVRHQEFQALMTSASVILTSPGLTTLIESGALDRPTVVLPPQNLSQFFNAEAIALCSDRPGVVVSWPQDVLDRSQVESVRVDGEDEALRYIYRVIAAHENDADLVERLAGTILGALREATANPSATAEYARLVGLDGAGQVAKVVSRTFQASTPATAAGPVGTEVGPARD